MKIIGITGGVGAGKSAILDYIEENYNARVLKADDIAHLLMEPGTDCYAALRKALPGEVFLLGEGIDRPALAQLMFSQENIRSTVNGIVHPAVKVYIKDIIEKERAGGTLSDLPEKSAGLPCEGKRPLAYLVIEAALLIEDHYEEICDELWYIYATEENRRRRLMESRGYSPEKIDRMFASQLPEEVYRQHCRVVIDNNGTREAACAQVAQALSERP